MASRREVRLQRLGRVTSRADAQQVEAARQRQQSAVFLRHGRLVYLAMAEAGLDPALCRLMPDVEAAGEKLAGLPYTPEMRQTDEALLAAQLTSPADAAYHEKLQRDFARLVVAYRDRTPDAGASFNQWYAWALNRLGSAERVLARLSQPETAALPGKTATPPMTGSVAI